LQVTKLLNQCKTWFQMLNRILMPIPMLLSHFNKTIMECGIADYKHKGLVLEITFTDGSAYEYFGVNANVYKKFIQSDKQVRFAKRFIYDSFLYRKSKNAVAVEV
jgi:hypothetical protein